MFRRCSAPSAAAAEGLWGREVGCAPISAPDALPLGRKRSCKLSPALLYRVQGRGRANHQDAQTPFKSDISPTGTNCPNNQHPNLLRASGVAEERVAHTGLRSVDGLRGFNCGKKLRGDLKRYKSLWISRIFGGGAYHVDFTVLRVYAGASGVRLRGAATGRKPGEARPLPVVSARLRSPPQERKRPESQGGGRLSPG